MTTAISCRAYVHDDRAACLAMFDTNAPDYFAHGEREDYERFLKRAPSYRVCLRGGAIVGAYGLTVDRERCRGRVRWIMTQAAARGGGLGTRMMRDLIELAAAEGVVTIDIAASQKSAPFFAWFGAVEQSREPEGWGPGLDRVHMELRVGEAAG